MKRLLIGFLAGLALGSMARGQSINDNFTVQPFAEGGTIWLKLSSGDYDVKAGMSDRFRVQWQPEDSGDAHHLSNIRVRTEISGNVATIRTDGPTKPGSS